MSYDTPSREFACLVFLLTGVFLLAALLGIVCRSVPVFIGSLFTGVSAVLATTYALVDD